MDIGNSLEELLIKCNKKIYLLFGNKYIDVLDADGNLNVRVKNIVNFRTPTSSTSDGFYYDGTNVYLKAGSDIINLSEVALPEGSIIMYEGDEAPDGWYKYADCDEFNGVIYIINKSGGNAEYKRATVTLSYNPSTINYTLGETFEPPRLGIGYNTAILPQFIVLFSSTNSTVASVDSNGQITPLSEGTAIIIAKIEDSSTVIGSQTLCTLNISNPVINKKTITLDWSGSVLTMGQLNITEGNEYTTPTLLVNGIDDQITFKKNYVVYSSSNTDVATVSKNSQGNLILTILSTGSATILAETQYDSEAENLYTSDRSIFYLLVSERSGVRPDDERLYTVGLLSDIHFHTLADNGTRSITTDGNGNSTKVGGDMNSLYDKDLEYLILNDFANVDFISSPGDIATYNINDFIYFTKIYRKAYTGSESGTNFKPFYCAIGNHDHGLIYCNNNGRVLSGGIDIGTYGNRWNEINFGGTNYKCPGYLSTGSKIYFGTKGSYFINKDGDVHIYLMLDYGPENADSWASLVLPHNLLSSSNEHVLYMMNKCGKANIFNSSSTERYFNFLYYNPYDLHYLGELILNNTNKRIFVLSHHFFTNKAGNNNRYNPASSTCLSGLTLHYLNWLNDNYTNVVFITGHSHVSWLDTNNILHWTNEKYGSNVPTTSDYSNRISENGTWDIKTESDTSRHYYSGMWNIRTYQEELNESTLGNEAYYRTTSSGTGGWNIHLPSMSRPVISGLGSQQSACEAAIMEVYTNEVIIKKLGYTTNDGVNYTEENIPDDTLIINIELDTSDIILPNIEEESSNCDETPEAGKIKFVITNKTNGDITFTGRFKAFIRHSDWNTQIDKQYIEDTTHSGVLGDLKDTYNDPQEVDLFFRKPILYNGSYKYTKNTEQLESNKSIVLTYDLLTSHHSDGSMYGTSFNSFVNTYFLNGIGNTRTLNLMDGNYYFANVDSSAFVWSSTGSIAGNPAIKILVALTKTGEGDTGNPYGIRFIFRSGQDMKIKSTGSVYYIDAIDINNYYNSGSYSTKSYEGSSGYETSLINVCYGDLKETPTPYEEPVDLGTAGIWSDHNIGATTETEYGTYFTYLEALALVTSGWRLPNASDFLTLWDNSTHEWTTLNGIYGEKFTNKQDSSKYVFFPAAGYINATSGLTSPEGVGTLGRYWTSTNGPTSGKNKTLQFNSASDYYPDSILASEQFTTDKLTIRLISN